MSTPSPTSARADVHVSYHQMLVTDGSGADHPTGVSGVPNGLTASAPGAAVILTGIHTGAVDVTVQLTDAPPAVTAEGWDEVEEVELITFTGEMRVSGMMMGAPEALPNLTPLGPGRYGMRVHARSRDLHPAAVPDVPFEFYLVTVWPIEVGPEACAKLGVGVAEELGLPDKSSEIRRWAREHARPEHQPGRPAREIQPPLPPTPVRGVARASLHRLRITNPYQPPAAEPALPEGLVAAAPDAVVIRTLRDRSVVGVHVRWEQSGARMPPSSWEQTEEIEFVTTTGIMRVEGMSDDHGEEPPNLTYQGVGRYGLRVYGRSRKGERPSNRPGESYLLVVWPIALGAGARTVGAGF
ncbi:hypothetical protein [Nonomuraea turcica]|uniref:hypothetical protein n=1 Tax=Nonomuraea sp. G32 TaxID=3067274 RepID=UPI00273B07E2|nr:hypothetical protein [Nonomuraea sp. G32]MDP4507518.1 hypothetical protein [Nonomuraea sp. G32]